MVEKESTGLTVVEIALGVWVELGIFWEDGFE